MHMCIPYHKYSGTLNTFYMLCPFNKAKSNIQRIQLESVLLSNAKWDTFIPSKVFISFVKLSIFIIYGTCSQKCTGNF